MPISRFLLEKHRHFPQITVEDCFVSGVDTNAQFHTESAQGTVLDVSENGVLVIEKTLFRVAYVCPRPLSPFGQIVEVFILERQFSPSVPHTLPNHGIQDRFHFVNKMVRVWFPTLGIKGFNCHEGLCAKTMVACRIIVAVR